MKKGIFSVLLAAAAASCGFSAEAANAFRAPESVTAKGDGFSLSLARGSDGAWRGEDVAVELSSDGRLALRSPARRLLSLEVSWKIDVPDGTMLLKDAWERTGGCSGWVRAEDFDFSPWYTLVRRPDGAVDGYGVKVQPNALVCWKAAEGRLTAVLDVSAGGRPLDLGARRLAVAGFVFRRGVAGEDAFAAGQDFCRAMCPAPRLPKTPVYGYNDWYCAYGKNTATNFLQDAAFICSLAEGLANRPYVVMDDGWQPNSPPVVRAFNPNGAGGSGYGPWDRSGEKFGMRMDLFAARVKALGARPGLWYRPYAAWPGADRSLTLKGEGKRFDPTNPKVREMVRADMARFREWGFDLVKIDYLTADLNGGRYALAMGDRAFHDDRGWADDTRTSAEVILDLHRTMREAAGDMVVIGCNALNHLIAGIFEVQRTGEDTSGWLWKVTRDKGVNTLAARAIQDRTFFLADADCVGLARQGAVPWDKNRQWLDLVSRSGTPLFISWHRSLVDDEVRSALKAAFRRAAEPRAVARPVDWFDARTPARWRFSDGAEAVYDWSDATRDFTRVQADVSALPEEMRFVGGLLADRVAERTPPSAGGEAFKVVYRLAKTVKKGDARVDVKDGAAAVSASDVPGFLAGTGNLLKSLTYRAESFGAVDGSFGFHPAKSIRIAYLARHFINPYMEAPADEMCRYMDDLALDGINAFNFQIRMPAVDVARSDDREKEDFLRRSRAMVARARKLGCALVGGGGSNQLPTDSPEEYRAAPLRNPKAPPTGFNACPARPGAHDALMKRRREDLAALADVSYDYLVNWPYDEGGCGCDACHPWGCNGFLRMCREYRELNRAVHPNAKTVLSTWFFTDEEYAGLWKYLETNDWVDYLMVDDFGTEYPKYPREHPLPGRTKIITFPEISMWGRAPWGGYGAIALPRHLKRLFRQAAAIAEGFEYYSEGFYEDVNKAVVTGLYVDPGATLAELLARYAKYHFAGADPADFVRLAHLLEDNHRPTLLRFEKADEAARLAEKMDAEILPALRGSWRWRIVLLRTLIDREILRAGDLQPAAARPYFDELVKIYHAERQIDWILEGRMGGWTSPRYLPAGRRFRNHAPPAGDATETARRLVEDKAFISVRLGPGTWNLRGGLRLARSRFELVLEDGCRLVSDGGGRLAVEGVDGLTIRGEGRASVEIPIEISGAKNVAVKGILAAGPVKTTACADVKIDLASPETAGPPPTDDKGLLELDRRIEWADQHLEQEKVERLWERLRAAGRRASGRNQMKGTQK